MDKNYIWLSVLFLAVGLVIGVLITGLANTNGVMVEEVEGPDGNLIGQAVMKTPVNKIPSPVPPKTETENSGSSGGGSKSYSYAGSLNYCVDRNSDVTAFINWRDEIIEMPLGLNTYKIRLSNYYYYNINFCKVEIGQYENCNKCWAELEE